ncbi:unnamed protein product, partial [Urochloa humidicola]
TKTHKGLNALSLAARGTGARLPGVPGWKATTSGRGSAVVEPASGHAAWLPDGPDKQASASGRGSATAVPARRSEASWVGKSGHGASSLGPTRFSSLTQHPGGDLCLESNFQSPRSSFPRPKSRSPSLELRSHRYPPAKSSFLVPLTSCQITDIQLAAP